MRSGLETATYCIHQQMCNQHLKLVELVGRTLMTYKKIPHVEDIRKHLTTLQVMGSYIVYCIVNEIHFPMAAISILHDRPTCVKIRHWPSSDHVDIKNKLRVCGIMLNVVELQSLCAPELLNDLVCINFNMQCMLIIIIYTPYQLMSQTFAPKYSRGSPGTITCN